MTDDIQLWLGDCLEEMKKIENETVDLIITDPPYGLRKFGNWDTFDQSFQEAWLIQANRVLKKNGQMYTFWGHLHIDAFFCMCWHNAILHWLKPKPIINPKSRTWVSSVEYILWWHKGENFTWNFPSHPTELCNAFRDALANQQKEKIVHRNQKPVSLLKKFIERSSNKGDLILDPFLGSGTTGVACVNTERNFLGIEINKDYFAIAKSRIENAQRPLPL